MKKMPGRANHGVHTIALMIAALFLLLISPKAGADNYTQLQGYWQCQEDGQTATLEFTSRQQLLYNGQAADYQLAPGIIQVQEEHSRHAAAGRWSVA